jgi:hypothetical protein
VYLRDRIRVGLDRRVRGGERSGVGARIVLRREAGKREERLGETSRTPLRRLGVPPSPRYVHCGARPGIVTCARRSALNIRARGTYSVCGPSLAGHHSCTWSPGTVNSSTISVVEPTVEMIVNLPTAGRYGKEAVMLMVGEGKGASRSTLTVTSQSYLVLEDVKGAVGAGPR